MHGHPVKWHPLCRRRGGSSVGCFLGFGGSIKVATCDFPHPSVVRACEPKEGHRKNVVEFPRKM